MAKFGSRALSIKPFRRKPLVIAADGKLWDFNSVFLDNATLNLCLRA